MTTLWIVFGIMLVAGTLFVCWPLYANEKRLTSRSLIAVIAVAAISGGLYAYIGTPGAPSGASATPSGASATPSGTSATPSVEDMVATLDARLQQAPDDVDGWKMLGRSYMQLMQYDRAVLAYEQALEREDSTDAQTYADLGEALLLTQDDRVTGRAAELFESSLATSPGNPKALFYGGIAAVQRGDRELAATRWETLLAQDPPPEVQSILQERIAEWRGLPPDNPVTEVAEAGTSTLTVGISVAATARVALPEDATVFVIARDPAQPSPPVAVTRRKLTELPTTVTLSDADAMIPGRTLGQFSTLEVVARASATGEPMPKIGDWFGSAQVIMPQRGEARLAIEEPVE